MTKDKLAILWDPISGLKAKSWYHVYCPLAHQQSESKWITDHRPLVVTVKVGKVFCPIQSTKHWVLKQKILGMTLSTHLLAAWSQTRVCFVAGHAETFFRKGTPERACMIHFLSTSQYAPGTVSCWGCSRDSLELHTLELTPDEDPADYGYEVVLVLVIWEVLVSVTKKSKNEIRREEIWCSGQGFEKLISQVRSVYVGGIWILRMKQRLYQIDQEERIQSYDFWHKWR